MICCLEGQFLQCTVGGLEQSFTYYKLATQSLLQIQQNMCSHWSNTIYIYFKKESFAKNTNVAHSSCATNLENIVFTIFRKLRETDKSMSNLVWKAQKVFFFFAYFFSRANKS